jgi:hypothetical protein
MIAVILRMLLFVVLLRQQLLRVLFGLLLEQLSQVVAWKFSMRENGEQFVTMASPSRTRTLFVVSWDTDPLLHPISSPILVPQTLDESGWINSLVLEENTQSVNAITTLGDDMTALTRKMLVCIVVTECDSDCQAITPQVVAWK